MSVSSVRLRPTKTYTQIVIISWVYGIQRSFDNLTEMGMRLNIGLRYYWWLVWVVLSPAGCVVSVFANVG